MLLSNSFPCVPPSSCGVLQVLYVELMLVYTLRSFSSISKKLYSFSNSFFFSEVALNNIHEIQEEYEISASAAEPPFLAVIFRAAAMPPSRLTCGRTGLHASGLRESSACVIGPTFSTMPARLLLVRTPFAQRLHTS